MIESDAIKLTEIIDVDMLMSIQEKLAKLVNFSVITVDDNGRPVGPWSNFSPFCKLIRSSEAGANKCIACDYKAGLIAMKEKKPRIYTCHLGLKDCVAPIFVNGSYLGSVLGGQVLLGKGNKGKINAEQIAAEFELPLESVRKAIETIPLVTRKYLEDCVDFYTFLANYVAEMSMNKLVQDELLRESRENFILEQKAKEMELKKIQAQINPHFLFNTLNTIARLALIEEASKTEELIYNLCDLLRYNLKNADNFPTIKDEIHHIEKYLSIQTLRYSDRIQYEMDVDPCILDYRIPSVILQPLVENSFVHGLEQKKEGGTIKISGRLTEDNEIVISIMDNGKGFSPEILQMFHRMKKKNHQYTGLGLFNTHDRLRIFFGDRYGLKIESTSKRTVVYVRIPCLKEHPSHWKGGAPYAEINDSGR
jgi:ligand-binding sensor protein